MVYQWCAVTFQPEDAVHFSLRCIKLIDKRRIFRYFSNLTLHFYDMIWKYYWRFEILGMRSTYSIHGPHATGSK